jgi:hypothetical protein
VKNVENRFYQAPDLDIERIAHDVKGIFMAQGYQVQHFGDKKNMVVQLRKGGDFEAILGMQAALTVTLRSVPGGVVALAGEQQWVDKMAAGALGMLLLWPLAFTASAGVIQQVGLESQFFNTLDAVVFQQKAGVHIGPIPVHLHEQWQQQEPPPSTPPGQQASSASSNVPPKQPPRTDSRPGPGKIQCLNCQEINEAEDFYCARCGKPLALLKKRCSRCNAEVKTSAAFCTKCGTSFS